MLNLASKHSSEVQTKLVLPGHTPLARSATLRYGSLDRWSNKKEVHLKNQQSVAVAARPIFEKLKNQLEAEHLNRFVAIEPISGEFFVGDTMSEAIGDSRRKYPDRLVHPFRIGHAAAVHFGMQTR